jgi:hypothetical protein
MSENEIAKIIVDAAFNVHKRLGPGLLEVVDLSEAGRQETWVVD